MQVLNVSKQILDFIALSVSGTLKRQTEVIANAVKRSNTSLVKSGKASTITFPVIVSDDIERSVAIDIGKDAETVLAYATKAFLEKKVNRDASELDVDDIISTLPIYNATQSVMDVHDMSNALIAESCRIASELVDKALDNGKPIAEASNVEIIRENGSNGTFINIKLPYIARARDGRNGEVKTLDIIMEFDAVIRQVEVEELVNRVGFFNSSRFFKSYVQLTKKEIKFMHDFLFDIDKLKLEAKDSAKGSKLFRDLTLRNHSKTLFTSSYPYTVMVLSDEVVKQIYDRFTVDLYKPRAANKLLSSFAAFSLYIVQNSNSTINIFTDGDVAMKEMTLDDLTKKTTKMDRKLRELVKLG